MMLLERSNHDISPLADIRLDTDEGRLASVPDSISSLENAQAAEHCEKHNSQPYWFRCPACSFDWREWIKPSITFVSLSFVTERCPNCGKRHVPACAMGIRYVIADQA
jgi:hypothetical protein